MSKTKRFIEQVSIDMGMDGEITDEVLEEANKRLEQQVGKHLFVSGAEKRRLKNQFNNGNQ